MLADVQPALTDRNWLSATNYQQPTTAAKSTEHAVCIVLFLQIDLSGHGRHMGMDIVWQLKLRPDGAFLETGVAVKSGAASFSLLFG